MFTYVLFSSEGLATDAANGGWFIPPVANIVIPLPLLALLPHVSASSAKLLLLAGYAGLGTGLLLFLLVAAVLFGRLVHHALPPAALAPSLWIGLGPIGVGSLALLRLGAAGAPYWGPAAPAVVALSDIGAAVLWGFGLWWLATAAALLVRGPRSGGRSLRRGPLGLHLPPRRLHRRHPPACPQLGRPLDGVGGGRAVGAPRRLLGRSQRCHPGRPPWGSGMAALSYRERA